MGKKLDKLLSEAAQQLQSGEQILAACLGNYETTYASQKTRRRGALIATTHRIILHAHHLTTTNSETYTYDRIGSIESGKILISGSWIKLNTTEHTLDVKYILDGDPEAVVQHVRARLTTAQAHQAPAAAPPAPAPDTSAADQLAQYASLLQQGLITREEFDQQKSRLLG